MTRFITHLLILFVLFTHSTMAMDVHIPHEDDHALEHVVNVSVELESAQVHCADAGGHCSHHQAHTAGLVSVHHFFDAKTQAVLLSLTKHTAFIHPQAPPLRPPKT